MLDVLKMRQIVSGRFGQLHKPCRFITTELGFAAMHNKHSSPLLGLFDTGCWKPNN